MFKLERVCIKCGGEVEGWTDSEEIVVRKNPVDKVWDDWNRVLPGRDITLGLGRVQWKAHTDARERGLLAPHRWCEG